MHLPASHHTATEAHNHPFPSNREQSDEDATVAAGLLPNQHLQYMRAPAATPNGEHPYEANG